MTAFIRNLLLVALALPAGAAASDLPYNYADLRLAAIDPDRGDKADGLAARGSFYLGRDLFATVDLSTLSAGGNGADVDTLAPAVGYRHRLQPGVDLFGTVGFAYVDISGAGDDIGPRLTGGARARLAQHFEAAVFAEYLEVFDDGDVALLGEVLYHFHPQFAAVGGVRASDDDRGISLGGRWHFPVR